MSEELKDPVQFLGPVDSAFYYVDSDQTPMNIGAVTIFEGHIEYQDLIKFLDSRLHHAPIYRKKVVTTPLALGQPVWEYDPDFYIGNHVMSIQLDAPATEEQLRKKAGQIISSMLSRDKPLWEVYLFNGLEGNRTAMMMKVHHCMVDGLSAVELFTLMMDLSPDPPQLERKPLYDPPPIPPATQRVVEGFRREIPHKWGVLKKLGRDSMQLASVFTSKEQRRKTLVGLANLINDNLAPIRKLPINGRNTGHQSLAWAEFSLGEVRAIKSARRSSINDVMLSVFSSAIEKYCADNGGYDRQSFVRILVPVNMRVDEEKGTFGNRIAVLPIDIGFGISDPLERLAKVSEYSNVMKESSLSVGLDLILTLPSLAHSTLQPLIWSIAPMAFSSIAHTWCTNVAGPQIPVYLMGHKMLHSFGYFPLNPNMGLACVVMSYNQRITMNLVADRGIVHDVTELRDKLYEAFLELRRAAKVEPMDPIVLTRSGSPEEPAPPRKSDIIEAAEEVIAEASQGPREEASPEGTQIQIFTEAWAAAFKEALNNSLAYRNASKRWDLGSLALVLVSSASNRRSAAIWLDLNRGHCSEAQILPIEEAVKKANFVIEGDHRTWLKALKGEQAPLTMITTRQLILRKGSQIRLVPHTGSAKELVKCAQMLPWIP